MLKISLKDIPSKDDYCIKTVDSEQYLYNTKKNEIVDLPYKEYKEIKDLEHQNSKVYATLLNNVWGAIKYNGKELIVPQFRSFYKLLFERYLCFEKHEERYHIYSLQGDFLSTISGFGHLFNHLNYLVFKDFEGKNAIYDDKLQPRTQYIYDEIESLGEKENNYFKVLKDGYWGVIQLSETPSKNITVLPCKLQEIESSFPGFSVKEYIQVKYNNIYYHLDEEGLLKEAFKIGSETKEHLVFSKKDSNKGKLIESKLNI